MRDFSSLRFVEIGAPWLKTVFPQQTLCFSNFHTRRTADPANGTYQISSQHASDALSRVART